MRRVDLSWIRGCSTLGYWHDIVTSQKSVSLSSKIRLPWILFVLLWNMMCSCYLFVIWNGQSPVRVILFSSMMWLPVWWSTSYPILWSIFKRSLAEMTGSLDMYSTAFSSINGDWLVMLFQAFNMSWNSILDVCYYIISCISLRYASWQFWNLWYKHAVN